MGSKYPTLLLFHATSNDAEPAAASGSLLPDTAGAGVSNSLIHGSRTGAPMAP